MGKIEDSWRVGLTRRRALAGLAGFFAAARHLLRGQQDPFPLSEHRRAPGLDEMENVWDFEAIFNANLPQAARDYTAHGDGTEWTLRRNRQAFDWVDLAPGRPADPKAVNLSTEVCGTRMKFPILIAPTAKHGGVHPEGEAASHRGASAAGTPYIVAYMPDVPMRQIAAAGNGPLWYQLYPDPNLEADRALLDEAQEAGCRAIVITFDQVASSYPRSLHDRNLRGSLWSSGGMWSAKRIGRGAEGAARYGVEPLRLWYNWRWLDQVRKFIKVPILAKGILTGEDARACAERGIGVIVSNHGGRSLDYSPSTLEVLPEITAAVNRRVPVLIDSGFRRGSDILKALALGADAVCVGRVQRWGLGAFGAEGVQRVLEILQEELTESAARSGIVNRAGLTPAAVRTRFS